MNAISVETSFVEVHFSEEMPEAVIILLISSAECLMAAKVLVSIKPEAAVMRVTRRIGSLSAGRQLFLHVESRDDIIALLLSHGIQHISVTVSLM